MVFRSGFFNWSLTQRKLVMYGVLKNISIFSVIFLSKHQKKSCLICVQTSWMVMWSIWMGCLTGSQPIATVAMLLSFVNTFCKYNDYICTSSYFHNASTNNARYNVYAIVSVVKQTVA